MAEDDADRERELEEEREAEVASELHRVGEDPDQVQEAEESLGSQNAPSGDVREGERVDDVEGDDTETDQADAATLPEEETDDDADAQ